MHGGVELFAYGGEHFPNLVVIPRANLRARFLQGLSPVRDRRPGTAQFLRRHACLLGGLEACLEAVHQGCEVRDGGLGRALGLGLAFSGLAERVLRALARVDGVAEGLAVVTLVDGGMRLLDAARGRGVLLGRVGLGAGRAREVDGRLRLVDFFLRRLRTARRGDEYDSDEQAAHGGKV